MKFSIPFDPEAFGEVAPGETVTVTGEAVLSDDGNILEIVSVEGVPLEEDGLDEDEDEDEKEEEERKEKKKKKKEERKEERTLEKDVARAEEATDAMGVLNAML